MRTSCATWHAPVTTKGTMPWRGPRVRARDPLSRGRRESPGRLGGVELGHRRELIAARSRGPKALTSPSVGWAWPVDGREEGRVSWLTSLSVSRLTRVFDPMRWPCRERFLTPAPRDFPSRNLMMSHGVTERCIGRSDSSDVSEHPLSHERLRGILERRDLRWQLLTLNHQRAGSANDRWFRRSHDSVRDAAAPATPPMCANDTVTVTESAAARLATPPRRHSTACSPSPTIRCERVPSARFQVPWRPPVGAETGREVLVR